MGAVNSDEQIRDDILKLIEQEPEKRDTVYYVINKQYYKKNVFNNDIKYMVFHASCPLEVCLILMDMNVGRMENGSPVTYRDFVGNYPVKEYILSKFFRELAIIIEICPEGEKHYQLQGNGHSVKRAE